MRTPLYETSSGALLALLGTRSFVWGELYTFVLPNSGPILRYTSADISITYGGNTYAHLGLPLGSGASGAGGGQKGHWKVGVDVDTWQLDMYPQVVDPITLASSPSMIGAWTWIQAIQGGLLDGCRVYIDRAYSTNWPTTPNGLFVPVGVLRIFSGRVAEIDFSASYVGMQVESLMALLKELAPRNVFQAPCRHRLFDVGCTLSAAAFVQAGTVTSSASLKQIVSTLTPPSGSGTFALGRLTMTSGANNGFSRTVKSWTFSPSGSTLNLSVPFPFAIAPGDTFNIYPGCDLTRTSCNLFNNILNYGGEPLIPAPELAI